VNFNKISYGNGLNLDKCTNWGGTGSNSCTNTTGCPTSPAAYSPCLSPAQEAQRYQWIDYQYQDLTRTQFGQMASDNPDIHTTTYIDPTVGGGGQCGSAATGSELVTTSTGGSQGTYNANEGNTGWQNQCYAQAYSHWTNSTYGGWNGALSFWDDQRYTTNTNWNGTGYVGGTATYPINTGAVASMSCPVAADSTNSYYCAQVAFEQNGATYAAAHGTPAVELPNISINGGGGTVSALNANPAWAQESAAAGAGLAEGFSNGGAGVAQQESYTPVKMSDAMWSAANSTYDLEHATPDSDAQGNAEAPNVYGLALLLVTDASGYGSWSTSGCASTYNCASNWQPDYNTALQLGPATGAMQIRTDIGSHTFYERDFANGVVVANPSGNSIASFTPTPGGTYTGNTCAATDSSPYGTCTSLSNSSTVTIGPTGGAILLTTR
jgi:hypothetical protein